VAHLLCPDIRIDVQLLEQGSVRRRITWRFAQANPIGLSFDRNPRLQQLSLANGVISFSEGNTHASGLVSSDTVRQSSMVESNPSESAAWRTDRTDFGESMSPR
jgi:hypothetical protein